MAGNDSRVFGRSRPHKRHLVRGSGGVQAEISDLRADVDLALYEYETVGQLAKFHSAVVPPTVTDDTTLGFSQFSKWIDTAAGSEYTCIDASVGAAVWSETTNLGVVPGGIVASVFGRVGIVTAASGDYPASLIANDSGVAGAAVSDALDALAALIPPAAPVTNVFGRTGAIAPVAGDYAASHITNDSGVSGSLVSSALDTLNTGKVSTARLVSSGNGLVGGGDLTADRTLSVGAHPDGSIAVSATNVRVGVLATDAQHGPRGGGSLHAAASGVSNGFMSFMDKSKLDAIASGAQVNTVTSVLGRVGAVTAVSGDYAATQVSNDSSVAGATVGAALDTLSSSGVPSTRDIVAGAGLVGGGDLSTDRTLDVAAHVDGSVIVNADSIQVGILATDTQHGNRGGGALHALASGASAGFMSPADKQKLDLVDTGIGIVSSWQDTAIDKDLTAPPGMPSAGDRYIVATPATGTWATHEDDVATWDGALWIFVTPVDGFTVYVIDENLYYTFNGAWAPGFVPATRSYTAGAGLTGGGDLSADRTFDVVAHADQSIVVNANDVQVGVLATDVQHGVRGGGTQHAVAVAGGASGFMLGTDKARLDGALTGYIDGLHVANDGVAPDDVVTIDPGAALSDDGSFPIAVPATLSPSIIVSGLDGLDTGTVAADTWYAVWVIADTAGVEPVGSLISLSFTEAGLTFPAGYDVARRVGAVRTDGSADIQIFTQPKSEGRSRWTYWREAVQIQTSGSATSFTATAVSAVTRVPPSAVRQQVALASQKDGGTDLASRSEVVPDGWEEGAGGAFWVTRSGLDDPKDPYTNGSHILPVGPSRLLRYRVQPAGAALVDVAVQGWEDVI